MKKRTIIRTLIMAGLAGILYIIGNRENKPIYSITKKFNTETDKIIEKLNSEEIQNKLKELRKIELENEEDFDRYRLAAIDILMVKDSNADRIIQIMNDYGLSKDSDYEDIANIYIVNLHKELGI